MKIHNLLKNPKDLPPIEEGTNHKESDIVYVLYRTVVPNGDSVEFEITAFGKCFYCHEDNQWYNLYDDQITRWADLFSVGGGQEIEGIDSLLDENFYDYPKEFVDKMTKVPKDFKCENIPDGFVFTKEIIGWFEIPTYEEFMEE